MRRQRALGAGLRRGRGRHRGLSRSAERAAAGAPALTRGAHGRRAPALALRAGRRRRHRRRLGGGIGLGLDGGLEAGDELGGDHRLLAGSIPPRRRRDLGALGRAGVLGANLHCGGVPLTRKLEAPIAEHFGHPEGAVEPCAEPREADEFALGNSVRRRGHNRGDAVRAVGFDHGESHQVALAVGAHTALMLEGAVAVAAADPHPDGPVADARRRGGRPDVVPRLPGRGGLVLAVEVEAAARGHVEVVEVAGAAQQRLARNFDGRHPCGAHGVAPPVRPLVKEVGGWVWRRHPELGQPPLDPLRGRRLGSRLGRVVKRQLAPLRHRRQPVAVLAGPPLLPAAVRRHSHRPVRVIPIPDGRQHRQRRQLLLQLPHADVRPGAGPLLGRRGSVPKRIEKRIAGPAAR